MAQGAKTCGQFDDDVCLEWGPAEPCAAGADLPGGQRRLRPCLPRRRRRPGPLPATCVQGACVVTSQCAPGGAAGCTAPARCVAANGEGTKGVCLESCDPLGGACSRADQRCALFGSGAYCAAPGAVPTDGACRSTADCVAGDACFQVSAADAACFQLCPSAAAPPPAPAASTASTCRSTAASAPASPADPRSVDPRARRCQSTGWRL
jgi:hypothetical protein